jgi:hypothetical protein
MASPDPTPRKASTGTMMVVGFILGVLTVVLLVFALR